MLKTLRSKDLMVRIFLGVVLGIVSLGMLLYLVPAPVRSLEGGPEGLADVAGERITATEVRRQLQQISARQQIPNVLQGFYMRQILDQMIFDRLLEVQAKRLGIGVTDQEQSDQIRQLVPAAFAGGTWVGEDRYAAEVQQRFNMSVAEFEQQVRLSLLEQKFRQLVTAGIAVTPEEVQEEFRRRNEKVKIDYVLVNPDALEAEIHPSDAEVQAYYEKNTLHYHVPERRSARYALLDLNALRQHIQISDDELRTYYNEHLDLYKVPNRVHVQHILFKTIGKTDAEVTEIRKTAEGVLKKAKQGINFEELAKKYSEDTATKDKGGDLAWIVQGQTVPEFEHAAFSLPKGTISDLVRTQYGFHILKVLDRETAHTKSFEEVRSSILPVFQNDRVTQMANSISERTADLVRQSNVQTLENVVKSLDPTAQQAIVIGETPLESVNDPVGDLGNSRELRDALFRQHPGELSPPIHIDRGYVILTVKNIVPAHQGTFAEVRSQVEADYRKEKSIELARSRAEELAKRAQSGGSLTQAAKSLGLEAKTSDPFSRTGTIPGVGAANQFAAAFNMSLGRSSPAIQLGPNWVVYRVADRQEPNPHDFVKQAKNIEQELLSDKRQAAFAAFRMALEDQMTREGKLRINPENVKKLMTPS